MARLRALILALAACVAASAPLRAQDLQRLTVTQLSLAADTTSPRVEVPFHLIVTARVRQRVARLENIDLPILAELELLGDAQSTRSDASGTIYRETITVVAHHAGDTTIAPVTLDAIDARDGRAKRYFSNALTLHVRGDFARRAGDALAAFARGLLALLLVAAGIGSLGLVVVLLARRPRPAPPVAPPPQPTPIPPTPPSAGERLREIAEALRADPTRSGALQARHAVRRMVGASDAETLDDVLHALAPDDPMRRPLRALERAAFTREDDLREALADALAALDVLSR
ncbi:MAG: hypothetical protein KGN02_09170 [bacterium]|nr:hypothetical protein [bacterium]